MVMYLGPTIPGAVYENNIYQLPYPEEVEQVIEKYGEDGIRKLFVPVSEVVAKRQQMQDRYSMPSVIYRKIREKIKEEENV